MPYINQIYYPKGCLPDDIEGSNQLLYKGPALSCIDVSTGTEFNDIIKDLDQKLCDLIDSLTTTTTTTTVAEYICFAFELEGSGPVITVQLPSAGNIPPVDGKPAYDFSSTFGNTASVYWDGIRWVYYNTDLGGVFQTLNTSSDYPISDNINPPLWNPSCNNCDFTQTLVSSVFGPCPTTTSTTSSSSTSTTSSTTTVAPNCDFGDFNVIVNCIPTTTTTTTPSPTTTTSTTTGAVTPVAECLEGLIIESIYIDSIAELELLPAGYIHPCDDEIDLHGCDRAMSEIYGNGVYIGDSLLNNNGTGNVGVQSIGGSYICKDYGNVPTFLNPAWPINSSSRYSRNVVSGSQALLIASNVTPGSTIIDFSILSAVTTYNQICPTNPAGSPPEPHTNFTWTRVSTPGGEVLFNGCVIGNGVFQVDVCDLIQNRPSCASLILGEDNNLYKFNSTTNTASIVTGGFPSNIQSVAHTETKLWLLNNANTLYEYNVTLNPFTISGLVRTISIPNSYTLSKALEAYDDTNLVFVDTSLTPDRFTKVSVDTNTPQFQYVSNTAIASDRLVIALVLTSTGKAITLQSKISDPSKFYLVQYGQGNTYIYTQLSGDTQVELTGIISSPTGIFVDDYKIYITNANGEIYQVDHVYPYNITLVTDIGVGIKYASQVLECSNIHLFASQYNTTTTTTTTFVPINANTIYSRFDVF